MSSQKFEIIKKITIMNDNMVGQDIRNTKISQINEEKVCILFTISIISNVYYHQTV